MSENSINSLQLLDDRLSILGDKVGPILFQLPPDFAADAGRLGSFLKLLPEHRRYSFEFRHPSWYAPDILRMLADRNIALCISDHHDAPAPWERTADFVYLRGHGPSGRYEGHYSRATLAAWRKSIKEWQQSHCDVYVYFDNDQKSAAPYPRFQPSLQEETMRRFNVHLVTEIDFVDGDEASDETAQNYQKHLKDTLLNAAQGISLRTIKDARVESVSVTEIKDEL